jgi:ppGpp synthetase/RelA/SpoT-type nucleotidyltranferase
MASLDFEFEKAAFRAFYGQNLELLETAQKSFMTLVNALVMHPGTIAVSKIEGRVKDKEECIRKFARKYQPGLEERNDPYDIRSHVTDLIGLRIVCLYEDEIDQVEEVLRSHFEVIEVTDKVSAMENTEGSFGYKGLHMDLRLNARRSALPEYAQYAQFRFELQVRITVPDIHPGSPSRYWATRVVACHDHQPKKVAIIKNTCAALRIRCPRSSGVDPLVTSKWPRLFLSASDLENNTAQITRQAPNTSANASHETDTVVPWSKNASPSAMSVMARAVNIEPITRVPTRGRRVYGAARGPLLT